MDIKTLTPDDLHLVVAHIPQDVRKLMTTFPLILGGGFIRSIIAGEEVQDIDLFGGNIDYLNSHADQLTRSRESDNTRKHHTPNAITVVSLGRMTVQFITRWLFDDPVILMQSFDFSVCRAAIMYREGKWTSCIDPDFYSDLAARRLVYRYPQRDEDAGGSMLRVRKFLMRGYNIQPHSLAGVIARLTSSIVARGGEVQYAEDIEKRLVEVDPVLLIDGVDLVDEHSLDKLKGE
jgi:hypothetical protein